jgi:hypothetical protein
MISLCLQCCPHDQDAALELTELICDLEPKPRDEFFLVYRKDCSLDLPKRFAALTSTKFVRCAARPARNHDVGYPGGSNMLAGSAFIEMSILCREKLCRNEAFLLFEPDCIPMSLNWIDELSQEWERVRNIKGKEAFGHWHQSEHPDWVHLNGNAVFKTNFFDKHPNLIIGPATMGWDFFFKEQLIALSVDSNLIFQHWQRHGLTAEEFLAIRKNGQRPALFHGIKTADGRANARRVLLTPTAQMS